MDDFLVIKTSKDTLKDFSPEASIRLQSESKTRTPNQRKRKPHAACKIKKSIVTTTSSNSTVSLLDSESTTSTRSDNDTDDDEEEEDNAILLDDWYQWMIMNHEDQLTESTPGSD